MSVLAINYSSLELVSSSAAQMSQRAQSYADDLSEKLSGKFSSVEGGSTWHLENADYMVKQKIAQLKANATAFSSYSKKVTSFSQKAQSADAAVSTQIQQAQDEFIKNNHLKQPDWKDNMLNWLIDLKNSVPLFDAICNLISDCVNGVSNMLSTIRYWYNCTGLKQAIELGLAFLGAVAAIMLAVAAWPAFAALLAGTAAVTTFSAICTIATLIGASIAAINALINVGTSIASNVAFHNGDYAWSKIHGDRNSLSSVLREHNFGNSTANKILGGLADGLDLLEGICGIITVVEGITKISSKIQCVKNLFNKDTGLGAYLKEPKWGEFTFKDPISGQWSMRPAMLVDDNGTVITHFTPRSIFNGLKSYITNDSGVTQSGQGLRTMLHKNFGQDVRDGFSSLSPQGIWGRMRYKASESRLGALAHGMTQKGNPNAAAKAANAWNSLANDYNVRNMKNWKNYANLINGGIGVVNSTCNIIDNKFPTLNDAAVKWAQKNTATGQFLKQCEKFKQNVDLIRGATGRADSPQNDASFRPKIPANFKPVELPHMPEINIPNITIPRNNCTQFSPVGFPLENAG